SGSAVPPPPSSEQAAAPTTSAATVSRPAASRRRRSPLDMGSTVPGRVAEAGATVGGVSDTGVIDVERHVAEVAEQGYSVVRDAFDLDLADALLADLDRL